MTKPNLTQQEHADQLTRRGYSPHEVRQQISAASERPHTAGRARQHCSVTPMNPGICTQSGRVVSLLAPDPNTIDMGDVAHGLAAVCRFSGQTRQFYSVAEHSLMVAGLVSPKYRLRALLHDATEAYLQDIPSPLKAMLPEYTQVEHRLSRAILAHFGMDEVDDLADSAIKHADRAALRVEMRDLFQHHPGQHLLPTPPRGLAITTALTPFQAKHEFIECLGRLIR